MATFEPRPFPKNRKKLKCAVSGCTSNSHDNLELCFHVLPEPNKRFVYIKDQYGRERKVDQLIAWTTILDIQSEVSSYLRICSLHFKKEDYCTGDRNRRFKLLYKTAIPSCNLPHSDANLIKRIEEREKKVAKEWNQVKPASALRFTSEKDCLSAETNKAHEDDSHSSRDNLQPFNFVACGGIKLENNSDNDPCGFYSTSDSSTRVETRVELSNMFAEVPENSYITATNDGASAITDCLDPSLKEDFGAQVNMHECKFNEILTNDRQLSTITGLKNFKVLHRIVEKVKMVTDNKYEKSTVFLNTEDRVVMTFIRLKQELSFSFIALMCKCESKEECMEIFLEISRIVYKHLDELNIPWATLNLEKILRSELGLALNANSSISDDEAIMEDEEDES